LTLFGFVFLAFFWLFFHSKGCSHALVLMQALSLILFWFLTLNFLTCLFFFGFLLIDFVCIVFLDLFLIQTAVNGLIFLLALLMTNLNIKIFDFFDLFLTWRSRKSLRWEISTQLGTKYAPKSLINLTSELLRDSDL